jgi:transposase-like protein
MAIPKVKATYSLDLDTVRALERLARRWGVPKSEALRRAIRAAGEADRAAPDHPASGLDALQRALRLTPTKAAAWAREVRAERRARSARSDRPRP